jgi:hypothetical protein
LKWKRVITLVLSLMLAIPTIAPITKTVKAGTINTQGQLNTPVDLGAPIQTPQTLDAAYGQENGVNVVYTTVSGSASSGDWATFNVIDIDNQQLLGVYPLEGTSSSWAHVRTSDGRVFIGASNKMFVYSPVDKKVTDLGIPIGGTESIWSLTADEQGNVYGGVYSKSINGRVFRVDAITLAVTDLLGGPVDNAEDYVRSIAYYNGNVYVGTGTTNGRVWKINPTTKVKERLELPAPNDPIYNNLYNKMGAVYGLTVVDHYLFAFFNGPFTMHVYDMATGQWRDKGLGNIRGTLAVTPAHNGKVYTSKKDTWMWEIDVETLEERQVMPFDGSIRSSAWIQVANQPEFTGSAMVTISFDGQVVLYDPPTQKKKVLRRLVEGLATNLQSMETGPDGKIYISSYMGSVGVQYDPATEAFIKFPLGQSEGMGFVGNTLYFGVYPSAEIRGWDTTTALPTSNGPALLFKVDNEQDRPFVLKEAAGKLLIGTIPGYSAHGGALTIYDPVASGVSGKAEFEVYRNIVENQSVTGLVYNNGVVFGSTSIHGGLGGDPVATKAKLFAWDMTTKQKLHEWDLQVEGLSNSVPMISGLTNGPDGLIWGAANGFVFAFDPITRNIVKSKNVHPTVTNYGQWRPIKMYWGTDGLLYTNLGSKLTVVNPVTMESRLLVDNVNIFTLDEDNQIYYAQATRVKRLAMDQPASLTLTAPATIEVGTPTSLSVIGQLYGWDVDLSTKATYTFSDSTVVRVENGQLIPLKAGSVTLTAAFKGSSSQSITVVVQNPVPVKVFLNVPNGSFEDVNEDGSIPGWSDKFGRKANTSVTSSTEKAKTGVRSLKVIDASTLTSPVYAGSVNFHTNLIEVMPGQEYTVSMSVYLGPPPVRPDGSGSYSSSRTLAQVRYYDAAGVELRTPLPGKTIETPAGKWNLVEIPSIAPVTAKYLRIIAFCQDSWVTTAYYDDVTISTMVDPNLLSKVEVLPIESHDLSIGSDVKLAVKAKTGSRIEVKEGDTVVATGVGAGDIAVELTIGQPTSGTHNYTVAAAVPGLGFGASVPVSATIHELTDLRLQPSIMDLVIGGAQPITAVANYGPVQVDVSTKTTYTASTAGVVEIVGNVVTGVKEGVTVISATYGDKQAQLSASVTKLSLQAIRLELSNSSINIGNTVQAIVTGEYKDLIGGGTVTRPLTTGVVLTSSSTAVAGVDGLIVLGKTAGETVLTARYNGMEATASLRVLNLTQPVKVFLDVANHSFEEVNGDGSIPGWSVRSIDPTGVYNSIVSSTVRPKTGERSLRIIDASTTLSPAYQSDLIRIEPGREYTSGVNLFLGSPPAKPEGGNFSSSRSSFQVRYYDASRAEIQPVDKTEEAALNLHLDKALGTWHLAEIKSVAPANAQYIRSILFTSPLWVSTAYYDDVTVSTMMNPTELTPTVELVAPLEQTEYKQGTNIALSVKATKDAIVQVLEGETIVATGIGAGNTAIQLVIAQPALGTHNYSLVAKVPGQASSQVVNLPAITVVVPTGTSAGILSLSAPASVTRGGEIQVTLRVDDATDLYTVNAAVYFDSTKFGVKDITVSDQFEGNHGVFFQYKVGPGGKIQILATQLQDHTVNGNMAIANITFTALGAEGDSHITLDKNSLTAKGDALQTGEKFTLQQDQVITIKITHLLEDVDSNGEVNIFDLIKVAKQVGALVTAENRKLDINGDGIIDIRDIGLIAIYMFNQRQ